MLIYFQKGLILEGEASFSKRKHFWSKEETFRQKIYSFSGVNGICDDLAMEDEITRLTQQQLKSSGWGKDFSGWQRVVPYEEALIIAVERGWDRPLIPTGKIKIEYINQWPMEKILQRLTGEQFAMFCKDNSIALKH